MDFLYNAETRVRQGELNSFLELAQQLGISGLIEEQADWLNECWSANQSEINLISNMLIQPVNEELNILTDKQIQESKSADSFENHTREDTTYKSVPSVQLNEESIDIKSVIEINSHNKPKTKHVKYYYEKKFDCDKCESKFTHKKGFLVHKQSKHEGMKFVCHECSKQFVQKGHLARHRRIRH